MPYRAQLWGIGNWTWYNCCYNEFFLFISQKHIFVIHFVTFSVDEKFHFYKKKLLIQKGIVTAFKYFHYFYEYTGSPTSFREMFELMDFTRLLWCQYRHDDEPEMSWSSSSNRFLGWPTKPCTSFPSGSDNPRSSLTRYVIKWRYLCGKNECCWQKLEKKKLNKYHVSLLSPFRLLVRCSA